MEPYASVFKMWAYSVMGGTCWPIWGNPSPETFTAKSNYRSVASVRMSLWVDKHRPSTLNKLDYHKDQAAHLKKLVWYIYIVYIYYIFKDEFYSPKYRPTDCMNSTTVACLRQALWGCDVVANARWHRGLGPVSQRPSTCLSTLNP